MDDLEWAKIGGGVFGAFLIFLLVNWGAESLYHVGGAGGHGHGDEAHGDDHGKTAARGWTIEVAHSDADAGAAEEGPSLEELLASADLGKGEKVFAKCKACHKLEDGVNGTGPHLFDVVDRAIGGVDGYAYSAVLADNGGAWTVADLDAFLKKPKDYAPGTKMSFNGLKKPADRANLIAYLQTVR